MSRYLLFLFIITLLYNCDAMAQQPIAWYKFDGDAADKSGNNNNGQLIGGITPFMDRFGNPCGALSFDGKTGYIEVPSSPSLESPINTFSITVWYRLHQANKMNAWLTAVCKGNGSNEKNNPQYRLQVQQNTITPSVICNSNAGSGTISISTDFTKCDNNFNSHPLPLAEWAFYALVYDGSSVTAWMNQQKVFEQNYTGTFTLNNAPLYIGIDEPGLTEYYWGALDDLRIYREALTEQQVLDLYGEIRTTKFDQEEFRLDFQQNHTQYVAKNGCTVPIDFPLPVIKSNCGTVTVTQTEGPVKGDKIGPGKYKINVEAISTSGYSQSTGFYITVADTIRPVLKMPKDTLVYVEYGKKEIALSYLQPTATDNCGVKEILLEEGPASNANFPLGQTVVKFRALDNNGNSVTNSFKVTVKEKAAPVAPTPAPPTVTPPIVTTTPPPKPIQPPALPTPSQTPIPPDSANKSNKDTFLNPEQPSVIDSTGGITPGREKRRKDKQYTVEVNEPLLKLAIYDNAIVDSDTATVFFNGKIIVAKQLLSDKPIIRQIEIDTTADNELILYAENLGTIPPNTAILIIQDGTERHEVRLKSDLGSSGAVVIRKKRKK